MAVVRITPQQEASGHWDSLWRRSYKRKYKVECDSRNDNEVTLRTALDGGSTPLLPRIGFPFRDYHAWSTGGTVSVGATIDAGSFVQEVDYVRVGATANPDHSTWDLEYSYGPYDANLFPSDPTMWKPKLTYGGTRIEQVLFRDAHGNPICNSAGQRFEDPTVADDSRKQFTVERNEVTTAFGLTLASTYNDSLNLNLWNGFAAETVKLGIITASGPFYDSNNQVWYYSVQYPFEVDPNGWQSKRLDEGFAYLDGSNKLTNVLDSHGQKADEPVKLDGSGHLLAFGATPVFLFFDKYAALDWADLALDLSARLGG